MAIDVDADAPTDGPKPAFAPGETNSGEEFEVNDSDLEEDDAMLVVLSFCIKICNLHCIVALPYHPFLSRRDI